MPIHTSDSDQAFPLLTRDLPGIGGAIKRQVADFVVEEIPLYMPCGKGDHVYFLVRKTGIPTQAAVQRIARYMRTSPGNIGVAGMKDSQAVTTQVMSLEHADPRRLARYRDAQMEVLEVSRHTNKLRTGHLAGNRFAIRIRDVGAEQLPAAREALDVLARRGVPNYFGQQRFGARGDSWKLGRALLAADPGEFLNDFVGRPRDDDPPDCRRARQAFDRGRIEEAMHLWPRHYADERKALSVLAHSRNPGAAVAAVDRRMRRLYLSAFQSLLFNQVLAERIDSIDRVMPGDLAQRTDSGGIFLVEDEAAEQERAEAFAISPTGPLFGDKCRLASGEPGRIEEHVLCGHRVTLRPERREAALKLVPGGRRTLRFPLRNPDLSSGRDQHGTFIALAFELPSGCYATVVLDEIMKR